MKPSPRSPAPEASQPWKAAAWMTGAIASFTLMAIAGRAIQVELTSFQLMFWRSAIGLMIVTAAIFLWDAGFGSIRTQEPRLHLLRNVFHFAGQNFWFYGIMVLPLGELVALEFTMPIWVALLAPLILAEPLTLRRLAAALLGFAGVLIVLRPGLQPLALGHFAGLAAALGFALNVLLTRRLMRHDGVLTVLFWMTASQSIFGFVLSFWGGFVWPSAGLVPWLLVVGVTGLTAHYSLTSALALAPAAIVAPMEFARLPVIALVGMVLYAEPLDVFVFLGALLIFWANWMNLRRK